MKYLTNGRWTLVKSLHDGGNESSLKCNALKAAHLVCLINVNGQKPVRTNKPGKFNHLNSVSLIFGICIDSVRLIPFAMMKCKNRHFAKMHCGVSVFDSNTLLQASAFVP